MAWSRLGYRREVLILLPAALLLLALLSTFTLLSYDNAVEQAAEQRRVEAARLAERLALEASTKKLSTLELLAQAPGALSVALLDEEGEPLQASGDLPAAFFLPREVLGLGELEALASGPATDVPGRVVGFAALDGLQGESRFLRVDLPAQGLGAQGRSLRILGLVVLLVNGGVLVLVLLFLRHLLAPWDAMLRKARALSGSEEKDEAALLLATFEEALSAQRREAAPGPVDEGSAEDDIAVLQRTLTDNLESGLLLLDRRGRVLSLNRVGALLLGIEAEASPGLAVEEVLQPHPGLARKLRKVIRRAKGFRRHEVALEVEGKERTVGLTVHLLRRGDQEVRGYLVLFADLTESRRRAQELRLEESLAQLGEMAAGMAHELRNGLATVRGYLTLAERLPEEEDLADYLQEIRRETDQLQRVLEDFLLFARPGTARPEETDLEAVVRRALADPALEGRGIDFRTRGDGGCKLLGDAQLLEHAVRNLLRNAARAQEEAGTTAPLEVALLSRPDLLELSIADRGPGVPAEVRDRLFQPFVSQFRGGVGLGLAVTGRIVSLHGGKIRLDERAGGGTRAVVEFPREKIVTDGSDSREGRLGPTADGEG